MKPLVIIGTGGLAREVYGTIKALNTRHPRWEVLGFANLMATDEPVIHGLKVVLAEEELVFTQSPIDVVIALGDPVKRASIAEKLVLNSAIGFPNIIHPAASLDEELSVMGMGCFVAAGAVLSPGVFLGDFSVVNMLASIAHDVKVGDYSVINPHANISGSVTLGTGVLIGASAVVHQGLELADGTILGMGAILTRNTIPYASYFGNPARKLMEVA